MFSCALLKVTCSQKFAFAQRSGAMKAPVGLLSDRTVLRSKMEGPRPDKWLFMQRKAGCANLAQKSPWFGQMCKRCAESVQPLSYIKKERQILRFDVQYLVHLQGLEPWAHWLRETNVQQSSIFRIALIRYFYRFVVNLYFASAASFVPAIPSCIRYPAVPVCKSVQSQNQLLKTGIGFLCKAGKMG